AVMRGYHTLTQTEAYALPITYAEMVWPEIITMHLEGNPGGLIDLDRFMTGAVQAYASLFHGDPSESFTVAPDLLGGEARIVTRADGMETIRMIGACEGREGKEFCSDRAKASFGLMGQAILIPWDADGAFTEYQRAAWEAYYGSLDAPQNL